MRKLFVLATATGLLAGCASIGTVNGIPVNGGTVVSTQGATPFCQANPVICIVGGAVGLGILMSIPDSCGPSDTGNCDLA